MGKGRKAVPITPEWGRGRCELVLYLWWGRV